MLLFDDYAREYARHLNRFMDAYMPIVEKLKLGVTRDELIYSGFLRMFTLDPKDRGNSSLIVELNAMLLDMYSEFYVTTYRRLLFSDIPRSELRLFRQMDEVMDFDDYFGTINREFVKKAFQYMLEYDHLTAYDKVLRSHLVRDKVEQIYKINPYYQSEYEKYNVEINLDFIYRQLTKYYNTYENLDEGLANTMSFLTELYQFEASSVVLLIDALLADLPPATLSLLTGSGEGEAIPYRDGFIAIRDLRILLENYFQSRKNATKAHLLKK